MSIDATRWAWRQQVKPNEKLVLLALADRAGESNDCWPSISRLISDTGLDRKTILSVIGRLEAIGLLVVSRELGKGNFYRLVGVDDRHAEPVPKMGPVPKTALVPKTGLPSTKNGTGPVPNLGHVSKKNLKITQRERVNAREGFAEFWQAYPRKVSKAQAERAWDKVAPDECLLRKIIAAVEGSKTSEQWQRDNGRFIPHPATWLNGRRWEDELPAPVPPTVGASTAPGQPGRAISPSSGYVNSRGDYGARRQSGGTSRREHSAAMGAALDRIIEQEFGS